MKDAAVRSPQSQSGESTDINGRIAARVRGLRRDHGLSLAALSTASGVSRSMISLIERGESSPTAVVLDRLAVALGVPLAALFDGGAPEDPVSRGEQRATWTDPQSGYRRRNLSPAVASPLRLVDVVLPAGAAIAYENGAGGARLHQQIWVLEGRLEVTVGSEQHRLGEDDCLACHLDEPTAFRNPGRRRARYLVAVIREGAS